MFSEADLIPISAIQHFAFCERQCALIHIEQLWGENLFTAEGRVLHEKAHSGETEFRDGVLITRSIPLRSLEYGLSGIADVIEFHSIFNSGQDDCVKLPGHSGLWRPFPVEYKRGREKSNSIDKVQLCAQVICLEEMLQAQINEGALYYGKPHRRVPVIFSEALRTETIVLIKKTHQLIQGGITPAPEYGKECEHCSLKNVCLPGMKSSRSSYSRYMARFFKEDVE